MPLSVSRIWLYLVLPYVPSVPEPPIAAGLTAILRSWQPTLLVSRGGPGQLCLCSQDPLLPPQVSAEAVAGGPASHQCGDHISQRSQVSVAADGGQVRLTDNSRVQGLTGRVGYLTAAASQAQTVGATDECIHLPSMGHGVAGVAVGSSSQDWGPQGRGSSKQSSALTRLCPSVCSQCPQEESTASHQGDNPGG